MSSPYSPNAILLFTIIIVYDTLVVSRGWP
jgi:hypothetical protein